MKQCSRCKEYKELPNFSKRTYSSGAVGFNSFCKECNKIYQKNHYKNNLNYHKSRRLNRKNKIRQWKIDYLQGKFCVDCGINNIIVLEFDHLYNKKYNIAQIHNHGVSLNNFIQEIQKCEVVCANCHRIRTAHRAGWSKG